jgi:hypothetical protein
MAVYILCMVLTPHCTVCQASAGGTHKTNSKAADGLGGKQVKPFSVNLMRSQVLYQAAQVLTAYQWLGTSGTT